MGLGWRISHLAGLGDIVDGIVGGIAGWIQYLIDGYLALLANWFLYYIFWLLLQYLMSFNYCLEN